MTSTPQWPLINSGDPSSSRPSTANPDAPVDEPQRDRAERFLHDAFRDGRLTTAEFERRFTSVMNASRRDQLAQAVEGIPARASSALTVMNDRFNANSRGRQAPPLPAAMPSPGTTGATLAHLSGLISSIFGPLVAYSIARPGTYMRREAAKAFNFQLVAGISFVAVAVIAGIIDFGGLVPLAWLAWFGFTIYGGVKAASGQDWANPVNRLTHLSPLPTDGR
ncbi:DUF1707 and DUF4870 domain-containing protein [Brooklawnia cerclae]|uniref:Tic20 family protein n=1 Tax=Brooklawnia cerclae TaxID=349934 RepID=A0ABX0SHT1_9ACTN|nr:DUF1707 and DUF4870 domain-containing protein [Brooklawnia cerclae]NIH56316.1 putative Tic20 family protein [Brooklawnia cerclae]